MKAESRDKSKNKVFQDLAMPRRILYYLNIVKAECRDFSKNKVFQDLTLPRRILYYLNIVKAECRDFSKNKVFQHLTLPRRILYYPNTVEARAETFQKRMFPYLTLSGRTYTYTFFKYRKYPPQSQTPYRRTDIYAESIPPFGHIARLAGYKKDARKGVLLFSRRTARG